VTKYLTQLDGQDLSYALLQRDKIKVFDCYDSAVDYFKID